MFERQKNQEEASLQFGLKDKKPEPEIDEKDLTKGEIEEALKFKIVHKNPEQSEDKKGEIKNAASEIFNRNEELFG